MAVWYKIALSVIFIPLSKSFLRRKWAEIAGDVKALSYWMILSITFTKIEFLSFSVKSWKKGRIVSNEENVSILSMINKHIFFLIVSLISTKCFRRQRLRFAMNFSFSFSLQIASTFLSNNSCVKSFITDITVEALSFIKKVHRYTSVIKFKLNSSIKYFNTFSFKNFKFFPLTRADISKGNRNKNSFLCYFPLRVI